MKTILFACVHNAGRSQMAAAWFNHLADSSKARAISAGTEPALRVHQEIDRKNITTIRHQLAANAKVSIQNVIVHRRRRSTTPPPC